MLGLGFPAQASALVLQRESLARDLDARFCSALDAAKQNSAELVGDEMDLRRPVRFQFESLRPVGHEASLA